MIVYTVHGTYHMFSFFQFVLFMYFFLREGSQVFGYCSDFQYSLTTKPKMCINDITKGVTSQPNCLLISEIQDFKSFSIRSQLMVFVLT